MAHGRPGRVQCSCPAFVIGRHRWTSDVRMAACRRSSVVTCNRLPADRETGPSLVSKRNDDIKQMCTTRTNGETINADRADALLRFRMYNNIKCYDNNIVIILYYFSIAVAWRRHLSKTKWPNYCYDIAARACIVNDCDGCVQYYNHVE